MAGCAFGVAVRVEFGPSAMILESGVERMWSISSRNGVQIFGNASTQAVAMPIRCTPWPGKKRAVLGGRDVAIVELHLAQLGLRNGAVILRRVRKAL